MARPMTPARRAALKKAQAASAAKRRGTGKKKPPSTRKQLRQANSKARVRRVRNGGQAPVGVTKKGKAKNQRYWQIEADRVNERRAIKDSARVAKGKKAKNKKQLDAKSAKKRSKRIANATAAAVIVGTHAYGINRADRQAYRSGAPSMRGARDQALRGAANKKRASNARKASAATRGIGKTAAKPKYTKPKGRKKVYKVTTAKKARRR